MTSLRFRNIILSLTFLIGLLAVTNAGASANATQDIIKALAVKMERSEIGKIEMFWEDLNTLTQVNITPKHFAVMKANPRLLSDPTDANDFHKIYVDAYDKAFRAELKNVVKSLTVVPYPPYPAHFLSLRPRSSSVDIRLSITFFDRNDSEFATLYFSYDGTVGAVNFDEVEFKGGLFDLLKKQYVDPQAEPNRKRE